MTEKDEYSVKFGFALGVGVATCIFLAIIFGVNHCKVKISPHFTKTSDCKSYNVVDLMTGQEILILEHPESKRKFRYNAERAKYEPWAVGWGAGQ